MGFIVTKPFEVFNDLKGDPLENGKLFIGTVNLNPKTDPIPVFFDEELTIPAAQPIRTIGGYPSQDGTPANIFIASINYSITVDDKNDKFVYSRLDSDNIADEVLAPDIISDLTAIKKASLADNQQALVGGYNTIGDGGGGSFFWNSASTATVNGGTIIASDEPGAGRWLRIFDGSVSIKWFGAKGDGIQDDTTFVQAALDYAKTVVQAIGAGVDQVTQGVFVPAGTYLLGSGVTVGEGTTFFGEGQNISFFKFVGNMTAITLGSSGTLFSGSWIIDIGVQGDDVSSSSIGIRTFGQIRNCGILRVFVLECDTLIKWEEAFTYHLQDSHLRGAGSFCLDIENGSHSIVSGCRFDVAGEHCVQVDGQTNETLGLNFQDCSFQSAQKSGFIGIDVGSVSFIDCDFESNNKINSLTHAFLRLVQGTAARTNNIYNISGGFWSTASTPGNNHVAIEAEAAQTMNVSGAHVRGNTFAEGITAGALVKNLNVNGSFMESVVLEVNATAATNVIRLDREGGYIKNNNTFDLTSTITRQDALILNNDASVAGIGNHLGSTSYTEFSGTLRRGSFGAKQTGADVDQVGFFWSVHPSTSNIDMVEVWGIEHTGHILPFADNTYNLGSASFRTKEIFSANGTINTSDGRMKTKPKPIDDKLMDAWELVSPCIYQYLDAVKEKGSEARIHTGYIVQEIIKAFEKVGIDPFKYGLICYDEFPETIEEIEPVEEMDKETGKIIKFTRTKRVYTGKTLNRYGLRYTHIIAILDACRRRDNKRFNTRLIILEKKHK